MRGMRCGKVVEVSENEGARGMMVREVVKVSEKHLEEGRGNRGN